MGALESYKLEVACEIACFGKVQHTLIYAFWKAESRTELDRLLVSWIMASDWSVSMTL